MTNTSDILQYQQGVDVATPPDGFEQVTNPLNQGLRTANRFAHFADGVYDLQPESHLSKLLKVILGDAGVGQLQKRLLLARLQASLGGTNFFDLDSFYGAIFGAQRRLSEVLDVNPHLDSLTPDEWANALLRDGSFRSRVARLSAAIHLGATAGGIREVAEAMIGAHVDVQEQWQFSGDNPYHRTWDDLEAFTWDDLEASTWDELETTSTYTSDVIEVPYNEIHVYPHIPLDPGSQWDVERALDRVKPAGSVVVVHAGVEKLDEPVTARAAADSEFWEIQSTVRNVPGYSPSLLLDGVEGDFITLAKPPWSWYAGEAWTHLVENHSVVAYVTDGLPSWTQSVDPAATALTPQRYVSATGGEIIYLPSYALRPLQGIFSGRTVSDGVLSAHPYRGIRQRLERSEVGSISTDGLDLDLLSTVTVPPNRRGVQFWTSPPRMYDDAHADTLEIRFDSTVTVNNISFEYAAFPCRIDVQAWTAGFGWVSVLQRDVKVANPYGISGAVPPGETNPWHFGSGHWVTVKEPISPVTSKSWRVVFSRREGVGPVGRDGKPVAYPVGLRNLDLGYRLNSQDRVPNTDPSRPFVSTVNPVGLPVQHYVVRYDASRVMDDAETFWQCEPQPVADAVVNLYLDLRTPSGGAQPVDRIWVDPVHTGPTFNLYWSDTDPSGDLTIAPSRDLPLVPRVTGSASRFSGGDGGVILHSGTPTFFEFDNDQIRFDPAKEWSFAIQGYSYFGSGSGSRFSILSAGSVEEHGYEDLSLHWDDEDGTISLRVGDASGTVTLTEPVASGSKFSIVVHHAEDGSISISFVHPSGTIDSAVVESVYGDDEIVNTLSGRMASVIGGTFDSNGLTVATEVGATIPSGEFDLPASQFEIAFWYLPTDSWTPAGTETLISVEGVGNNAFRVQSLSSGNIRLSLSEDGTAWVENYRDVGGVDGVGMWLRLRWDGSTASIWSAQGEPATYPSDSAWALAGTTFTLSVASIFASSADLTIGTLTTNGTIGRVILRDMVGGSASVDVNFARTTMDPDVIRIGCQWAPVPISISMASLSYGTIPVEGFSAVPDAYTRLPVTGGQISETYGAMIRMHPDYYNWTSSEGFCWGWMGGALNLWDAVEWKPLVHNVAVEKGDVDFDLVFAKYLKAEFTNLVAQPYDALVAGQRSARRLRVPRVPPSRGGSSTRSLLEARVLSLSGVNRYVDAPSTRAIQDPSVNGVYPTAAITPTDPRNRADLARSAGYAFGMVPWQPSHTMGINESVGTHSYEDLVVESVNKVAFFIGIRSFKPKRTSPTMLSNSPQYFETFLDTKGIDTGSLTMNFNPGYLFTTESDVNALLSSPMTFESQVYSSRLPVQAVQFASQQSGPFQIIPDDEFSDPSLTTSDFSSTDGWHASGDGIVVWDAGASTVKVTRDPSEIYTVYTPSTTIVHPIVSPIVGAAEEDAVTIVSGTSGGISSPLLQPSPRGTIFIGTRVTAVSDLSAPLVLRVYGNDETTVLLEYEFTPDTGVPTEVTLEYVVGSSPLDSAIQVRIEQDGPWRDSWLVHSLSAFDDSVFWEVSNDGGASWVPVLYSRNLIYGAVQFPDPGAALCWRATCYRYNTIINTVDVRPWYSRRTGSP